MRIPPSNEVGFFYLYHVEQDIIPLSAMPGLRLESVVRRSPEEVVEVLNDASIAQNSLSIPFPYSLSDAESFFAFAHGFYAARKYPPGFFILDQSNRILGGIGMLPGFKDGSHCCEIGYWLGKEYRGKGIMRSAVRTYVDYLHEVHRVVRIEALVFSRNYASARLLEKSGFRLEGFLKKRFLKNEEYIDALLYARIKG